MGTRNDHEYVAAPGVTDEQIAAAVVAATDEAETLRNEVRANPGMASASRLFAMLQYAAEADIEKLGITEPKARDRAELVIIAGILGEMHGILVEEMTAIILEDRAGM